MSKGELIRQWEESIEEPTIEFEASIVGLANHIFDKYNFKESLRPTLIQFALNIVIEHRNKLMKPEHIYSYFHKVIQSAFVNRFYKIKRKRR